MPQAQTVSGTVVGYFEQRADALKAVEALREAGFSSANVGVAHRDEEPLSTSETRTDAARSHTTEAKAGGVWDKVKNFFEGGDVEPYADEKQQGELASREITSDADTYGSHDLQGTLNGMSVNEDRSRYFGHRFGTSDSGALVTVSAPGRESEATAILERFGADLGDASESYDYAQAPTRSQSGGDTQNIQLLGEVLRVHKDRVSRGDVTLRKEVTTEMQTIQVPVTREELVIERHAVSGETPATGTIGETGEIRIPLTEERASADKSTFVREEVSVGKRAVQEVREVSGEVRSEELVVDDSTKTTPTR